MRATWSQVANDAHNTRDAVACKEEGKGQQESREREQEGKEADAREVGLPATHSSYETQLFHTGTVRVWSVLTRFESTL